MGDPLAIRQLVYAQRDHVKALILVLLVEGFEVADLVCAKLAVAGVEIHQHNSASHLLQIEGAAGEERALQGRGRLIDLGHRPCPRSQQAYSQAEQDRDFPDSKLRLAIVTLYC
jgi:hypothetical protein